jgi:hypothetical protein
MRDVRDCPQCGAEKGVACRTPSCPQLKPVTLEFFKPELMSLLTDLLKLDAASTALDYLDKGIGTETEMAVWLRVRSLKEKLF